MNKARPIITALHPENLTQQAVAARYGVSQSWVSKLKKVGEADFHPKSKRPRANATKIINELTQLILALRKQLSEQGHGAGTRTVAWHLSTHHNTTLHPSTVTCPLF